MEDAQRILGRPAHDHRVRPLPSMSPTPNRAAAVEAKREKSLHLGFVKLIIARPQCQPADWPTSTNCPAGGVPLFWTTPEQDRTAR